MSNRTDSKAHAFPGGDLFVKASTLTNFGLAGALLVVAVTWVATVHLSSIRQRTA